MQSAAEGPGQQQVSTRKSERGGGGEKKKIGAFAFPRRCGSDPRDECAAAAAAFGAGEAVGPSLWVASADLS